MSPPVAKGILVSADGSTEIVEPLGQTMVRSCACCGAERKYEMADRMAANRSTLTEEGLRKLELLTRGNPRAVVDAVASSNAGCVVYIEVRP